MAWAFTTDWMRKEDPQGRAPKLNYAVWAKSEAVLIAFSGDMDLETSAAAHAPILEHVDSGRDVIVDLRGVSYLGSAAIAVLVEALHRSRSHGRQLTLVATSRLILRSLELARLHTVFTVLAAPPQQGCERARLH